MAVCVGHTESVGAVVCSRVARGGKAFVVSGSRDLTLKVWPVSGDANVAATSESADADAADDASEPLREVLVRDGDGVGEGAAPAPRRPLASATRIAHEKEINCVALSPDESLVASGSADRSVRLWRLPTLAAAGTLLGHRRGVWAVKFAPTERALVSASADNTLRLWSLATRACLRSFDGHTAAVLRCAFLCGGAELVSAASDGVLRLWRVADATQVNAIEAHDGRPWALAVRRDGAQLVTAGDDGTLCVWRDTTARDAADAAAASARLVAGEQVRSGRGARSSTS